MKEFNDEYFSNTAEIGASLNVLLFLGISVILAYAANAAWKSYSDKNNIARQMRLDEERLKTRRRQQDQLMIINNREKPLLSVTNDVSAKAHDRPQAKSPSTTNWDSGYNPLLGGGGGPSYRPSGFKRGGSRGG